MHMRPDILLQPLFKTNDCLPQATGSQTAEQRQVYFDVSVDGEPKGRLVIQLSGDAPVGTQRFAQLSQGLNGVGYRLSKFDGIAQVQIITLRLHTIQEASKMFMHSFTQRESGRFPVCMLAS